MNRTLLTRERERFHRRRRKEQLRSLARAVLFGRWDMKPGEILTRTLETYPDRPLEEVQEIAEAVRRVQREERPRRVPVGSVEVKPLEIEREGAWGTPRDVESWRRIFAASMENRPVVVREREVEG